MSVPDIRKVLREPGKLCIGPTDLNLAFPHGGTALGSIRQIRALPGFEYPEIIAEEFGAEVVEKTIIRTGWAMAAILREFDNDAISTVFPSTVTGESENKVILDPGTVRSGTRLSTKTVKLLFSPRDQTKHFFLLYRALPEIEVASELALGFDLNLEFPVVFSGIRDTTGRMARIGLKQDLKDDL